MFVNNYCLSMNCIIAPLDGYGGIYLGNLDAAKDSQLLTQYNIGAVLQVLDQSVPIRGAQKLWIMAEDSEEFPLNKYFEQAIKFIENQSKKTNVLVHCYAGIEDIFQHIFIITKINQQLLNISSFTISLDLQLFWLPIQCKNMIGPQIKLYYIYNQKEEQLILIQDS